MLDKLTSWAVSNRLFVVLALLGAVAGAILLLPRLALDAFPDVTNVQVDINTAAAGLAAEEVEQLITYPLESAMYSLPGVTQVRSLSRTGLSMVTVVFEEETDVYFARQLVQGQLQEAREAIPEGVGTPEMGPNTSGLGQVYQYLLRAEPGSGYDVMSLRSLNDTLVKRMLMPVDGVTEVLSFGGEVRQYQVRVDPDKLLAYGLDLTGLTEILAANNRNTGGWFMPRGQEQFVVRGYGFIPAGEAGLDAIRSLPLATINGTPVTVEQVAEVGFGSEIRVGAVSMTRRGADGQPVSLGEVVSGVVLKRMGANTKITIDDIKARLPQIQAALPPGVVMEPYYDNADLVAKAVKTVSDALAIAFALIVVILALFLLNLRATALVLLSIPIAIGLALMVMAYLGLSANLMSLGGLAVAIGMLVDGSVVMVENIFKHLNGKSGSSREWIKLAAREVARPVFFATGIIILVFAPLFTLEGVEGKLFQPMAVSIILAMLAALLTALVVVPALASYLFPEGVKERPSPILQPIERAYRAVLAPVITKPKSILIASGLLLVATAMVVPRLGTEFVPELEEGTINIRVTLAPTASLETSLQVAPKLEAILLEFPEVEYALSRIGAAELGGDPEPINNIEIYVGLKPVNEWSSAEDRFALQALMEEKLSIHPGLLFTFSQPIATRVDELLSGVRAQLAIKLFGPDLEVLSDKGAEIEALVKSVEGATDVALEQISGELQLVVRPNREALSRYGMTVDQVLQLVSDGIGGVSAGQVIDGNARYDILVRYQQAFRDSPDAVANLLLRSPDGALVRLGDVATIAMESAPPNIRRDDVQRRVVVQANVVGRDMGSVVAEIYQRIDSDAELPPGYAVQIGGQYESQLRAQKRLAIVVPISIALIALLLYFAFGSVRQAVLVMANVPLALIGGVMSLWLTGTYLSVPSSIGFITLFGVAVLNGVVLVDAINNRIVRGEPLESAVFEGAISRLRPVLMTALTSALGLIPVLLSSGVGAEVQRPLAMVIIGGLLTSTALTLLVLPTLYRRFPPPQP
ncbi:efflux RND transporter permease subunit [Ferrimonas balearica]|uniref:efflux RND transporter permease subunit n=1 Tax=Ferrimonas balearica TaxID=44012 RepID=UPI001C99FA25|nr:CusA/CzcA family heavy metal efflux RND transporter [Ferrimonas balearica]MBY5923361.1 CusA/CzcA family heavy metal efflux RND transporter [Ferrimonas balearica]MBY5995319.1 CusA/CzcA family heavy metal efflux RND transporter [Ferrimonas balearica]